MTVHQLIEKLKSLPPHMEVMLSDLKSQFQYGPVEQVETKEIGFSETPDSKPLATEAVVVLSDH